MPGLEWLLRKEVKRSHVERRTSQEEGTLSLQAAKALPRASPEASPLAHTAKVSTFFRLGEGSATAAVLSICTFSHNF